MFDKLLVANRGEIACRVIETARKIGLATVAVYSDADARSRHVELADEAVWIGPSAPSESYLKGDVIITAALETGAGAIHPGYGFLSENPDFVESVEAAGLVFVGPSASAIRAMGLKDAAKSLMSEAGVPVVPGYQGKDQEPGRLEVEADTIGYPVLIKAVAGGGGKGMRRVERPEEFIDALESAKAEARTAFGNDSVLIEKYVEKPRHIEVQIFGDGKRAVHLFERDCSLQRRHQKLVEEAPAPFLTEDQVSRLYESSKAILREAEYVGAGTCEFLVAKDGTISFLEVNTRLQVEHCVSEEVTGIDLVREMFRIAAGEELGYGDPEVRGHSIEFRINAEDGGANFMPAPGTLSAWSPPSGPGVRLDGGYENGETIPGSFDSLIAKLIVTGRDRTQALERSRRALDEFVVDGMPTVIPFHRTVVRDPAYVGASTPSGEGEFTVYTTWIETDFDNQIVPFAGDSAAAEEAGERQTVVVEVGGKRVEVIIPAGLGGLSSGGAGAAKKPKRAGGKKAGAKASGDSVTSPMQGTIVKVTVEEGQEVAEGDTVVVIEAMKMEQPLKAHKAGTVTGLAAEVGATVTSGAVICELKD